MITSATKNRKERKKNLNTNKPEKRFLNGSSQVSNCISFILEHLLVKILRTKLCNYLTCKFKGLVEQQEPKCSIMRDNDI